MVGPRSYSRNTVMALGARSGHFCYWPGCPEPLFADIDVGPRFVAQIAHIRAAEPGGARYDASMTDDERRDFRNLILLCYPHHVIADDKTQARRYTVEVLFRWKEQREADPAQAVQRLRAVTPEALTRAVAVGVEKHNATLLAVLDRLKTRDDRETAAVVRGLVDELTEAYSRLRRAIDRDTVEEFSSAVYALRGMQFNSDTVEEFSSAVDALRHMHPTLNAFVEGMDR
jgi:hypothetical protein